VKAGSSNVSFVEVGERRWNRRPGGGVVPPSAVVKCKMTIMSRLEFERAVKTEH
jgi:hypothetical protein